MSHQRCYNCDRHTDHHTVMQIREDPDGRLPPYEVPVTECLACGAQYSDVQAAYFEAKAFLAAGIPDERGLHQRLVDRYESGEMLERRRRRQ